MGKTSKKNGFLKHKCESCGKSFCRAYVLKIHIHTIHEGHKDHKCESCVKSFSAAGNLKKHIPNVNHAVNYFLKQEV